MSADQNQVSSTPLRRSPTLYVILLSTLIGVMGVSLLSPILPDLRSVFDITDTQVGLIITAYTLPGVVLTPFVGFAADRIGRRRVLIPLLFMFGISGSLIAFSTEFTHVLVLRFIQGIGASALVTIALTLIGDFYTGETRDTVMGLNGSMIGVGAALYPLIGGVLGTVRWNYPFLFFSVAVLVGIIAIVALTEPESDQSTDIRDYIDRLRTVMMVPQALAVFATVFLIFFVFYGAVLTALPLLLSDDLGLGSDQIGALVAMVAVANAVVSLNYGYVSTWRKPTELVALGFALFGSSLVGVWLAPTPILIGFALLLFGTGFGIALPAIDTAAITLVDEQLRAGIMGMRTSMLRLGQTLGPIGFTFAAETAFRSPTTGYRFLLIIAGAVFALSGIVVYLYVRRH